MKTVVVLFTLLAGAQSFGTSLENCNRVHRMALVTLHVHRLIKSLVMSTPFSHLSALPLFSLPLLKLETVYDIILAPVSQGRVATTPLFAAVSEDQLTPDQLEIKEIQKKWREIRLLGREEAQQKLEGEWLEAYNRFYEKYDEDMAKMVDIVDKLQKQIDPPRIKKKTRSQKKRDAYARKLARSGQVVA
jgi:hypothetical protein